VTIADLQAQLTEARVELAAATAYARARLVADLEGSPARQAATMADVVIDDMGDEDEHDVYFLPYDDEEGVFVRAEQGHCSHRLRASLRTLIAVGFSRRRHKLAAMPWP
jgi:hypothetical protein